jgi:hypothetical protein
MVESQQTGNLSLAVGIVDDAFVSPACHVKPRSRSCQVALLQEKRKRIAL